MSNAPNDNLSQEAPQWMRDMFEELKDVFEGLFPDADKLDQEMQRRLDEQQADSEKNSQ
jgi:PAB1-binding protein PBP1